MPKRSYTPTEQDAVTGRRVRDIRNRRGETLKQTVDASGFGRDASTLAAVERGERRLTEIEATKLAAHFGTTPGQLLNYQETKVVVTQQVVATEQEWLGNPEPDKPALFAVPDGALQDADRTHEITLPGTNPNLLLIDLREPLTPAQYREQVWIPYLEQRYAQELKQTG